MSQMPDKIWLHKDTKYNTADEVFGYQYEFAEEIQSEGIENFIEYVPLDAFVKKVVNFLEILGYAYTITDNITKSLYDNTQLIEDFKKYMEE